VVNINVRFFEGMQNVIDLSSESDLQRLRDYKKYRRLTKDERAKILELVLDLDPNELNGKSYKSYTELNVYMQKPYWHKL